MTTTPHPPGTPASPTDEPQHPNVAPAPGPLSTIGDALVVAKRNLIKIKRVPDLLVFTTMSPIMFILLFAYVFGGAIDQEGGGEGYREFLIAGIFAQTVVFGATITPTLLRAGRPATPSARATGSRPGRTRRWPVRR